jgi:hypothetical protein
VKVADFSEKADFANVPNPRINQSEAEVKIHLQIKEYQQLWPGD